MQHERNGFFQGQKSRLPVMAAKGRQVRLVSLVPHIPRGGLSCSGHMETLHAALG